MNPHALFGVELDKACAETLGWELQRPEDHSAFYQVGKKRLLLQDWKPTLIDKQCMRLITEYKISIQHMEKSNIWRAYFTLDSGETIEAKARKLNEAVCRCFVLAGQKGILGIDSRTTDVQLTE
jgi:hypothetical protein